MKSRQNARLDKEDAASTYIENFMLAGRWFAYGLLVAITAGAAVQRMDPDQNPLVGASAVVLVLIVASGFLQFFSACEQMWQAQTQWLNLRVFLLISGATFAAANEAVQNFTNLLMIPVWFLFVAGPLLAISSVVVSKWRANGAHRFPKG
jgi:hypothetical protein